MTANLVGRVNRIAVGAALVVVGSRALELGFDLLTQPSPARVVKEAEDVTRAAVEVPHPFTQEGTA